MSTTNTNKCIYLPLPFLPIIPFLYRPSHLTRTFIFISPCIHIYLLQLLISLYLLRLYLPHLFTSTTQSSRIFQFSLLTSYSLYLLLSLLAFVTFLLCARSLSSASSSSSSSQLKKLSPFSLSSTYFCVPGTVHITKDPPGSSFVCK